MIRFFFLLTLGCFTALAQTTNSAADSPCSASTPYVQALAPDAVAVHWRSTQPSLGWVEYGESPELGRTNYAVENGLRRANVLEHRVVLDNLRPGASYWYRIGLKPIRVFKAYQSEFDPEQRSELYLLQTLPRPAQPLRVVVFNDLHNRLDVFDARRKAIPETEFDFSLFNGDCLADPAAADKTLATLAALTAGVQASSRPAFFIRGNHETRGAFARELPRFFSWPGSKPYFAFSAGSVRFLVLDFGEDKPDDHKEYSGLVDFESYRAEETAWLKQELASQPFRKARWRVLVAHLPLVPASPRASNGKVSRELWQPLLAKARIDLALHAHLHHASYHPPGSIGNPYPIYIGGGNTITNATAMILEADHHNLSLRILNAKGQEALPSFTKTR